MIKFFGPAQDDAGNSLKGFTVRILDNLGAQVAITADKNGTNFETVNICPVDDDGMAQFWYTPATGQEYQLLDLEGSVIKRVLDFSSAEAATQEGSENVDTVLGVDASDGNLGSFAGSTIPDDQAVKPALQALETSLETKSSSSYDRSVTNSVAIPLADKVGQTLDAAEFGVVGDGVTDCTTELQNAIDYMQANLIDTLILPSGEIVLSGDVTITEHTLVTDNYRTQTTVQGRGAGINGSWLHFSSGSLIVEASSHSLRDFRVSSDDDNGIEVRASSTPRFPVRSEMRNVRSEFCLKSGVTIEDCWLYTMVNCYFRQNDIWGIAANSGSQASLSCNNLNIIGGEIQGNGTFAGTGSNSTGGTLRGTGGGIFIENAVQVTITNTAIEGNYGDGLFLGEEVKGIALLGCYFEKNGTHQDNLDIACETPSSSVLGGHSAFILNCNFTPQNLNGTAQVKAIELVDFKDAKIVNPVFFAQSGPVIYSAPPIRVTESLAGRSTGWVEGGSFLNSAYTQDMINNECTKYGAPQKTVFANRHLLADDTQANTTSGPFVVPMSSTCGYRVDVNHTIMPAIWTGETTSSPGSGVATILTTIRRGMTGTGISTKTDNVNFASAVNAITTKNSTSSSAFPGTFVSAAISRNGGDAADTLAVTATLISMEIIIYEGWVRA